MPENLSVPLEGERDFGELCGSQQGCQVPFRPPIPNVGLLPLEKNIALEKLEEQMDNVTQFIFLLLIVIYFSTEREYILWVMGWTTVVESQGQSDLKLKNLFWRTVLFSTILHSKSAALNMPANLENSAVATGLEKVSFHSNPKERQCQRLLKLPHNCTHLTH